MCIPCQQITSNSRGCTNRKRAAVLRCFFVGPVPAGRTTVTEPNPFNVSTRGTPIYYYIIYVENHVFQCQNDCPWIVAFVSRQTRFNFDDVAVFIASKCTTMYMGYNAAIFLPFKKNKIRHRFMRGRRHYNRRSVYFERVANACSRINGPLGGSGGRGYTDCGVTDHRKCRVLISFPSHTPHNLL